MQQQQQQALQPGTRKKIEHYSYALGDRIGKGYSSVVYRGRNDQSNEVVAIKVIDLKGVKDEAGKEMLDCQVEALKTLKHPNILRCYDVFTTANNCYIITEFCGDGDLAGLLAKKRRLSESETVGFLRDIVGGFIELADNNYLHRDLKLANIFLNGGAAKIADFGFAKKNKQQFDRCRNPGQKQKYNVGSPLYMSPQALKRNIYSVKNDIWSIGVILFELLHGETPWECKTEKQLMDKMVRVPVTFTVKVSEELKNFIKKCLEVDESRRMSLADLKASSYIKPVPITTNNETVSVLGRLDLNKKQSQNKQNQQSELPKQIVDRNNQILVNYINMFRLLYKILDQLTVHRPNMKQLVQSLSNEVLDRVMFIKNLAGATNQKADVLEFKETEKYFNEQANPAIKKYRTVIQEYYKKYTTTLKHEDGATEDLNTQLRNFLRTCKCEQSKEAMLFYWIAEYLQLPKEIKKDYIEGIIEPKNKPTLESVRDRIRQTLGPVN